MRIFGRPLREVTASNLHEMLGVAGESTFLDFKREMYSGSDADRKEFAKDVSGLANAAGGYLVIGIAEDGDGVAVKIAPIVGFNQDRDILRFTSILRDGVEPRLTGIDFVPVPVDGGHVLIVEVQASWNPPHRVNMKSNQFFLRHPRSTDPMSVEEIRDMILRTANREIEAHEFRVRRMRELRGVTVAGTPNKEAVFILHIMPMSNNRPPLDMRAAIAGRKFFPPLDDGYNVQPNFDGAGRRVNYGSVDSSIQVYRRGLVEAVMRNCENTGRDGITSIHTGLIQTLLFKEMPTYVSGLEELGFEPPYAIFATVAGALGKELMHLPQDESGREHVADRDELPLDPVLLESVNIDGNDIQAPWRKVLRPAMDQLWQSFGFQRCYSFNEDGSWRGG